MPRFSRSRVATPKRRTNWVAAMNTAVSSAYTPGTSTTFEPLVDAFTDEAFGYVSPTLTRIRGSLLVDPDFGAQTTSQYFTLRAILWVGPASALTDANWTANPNNNLSSDRIIWADQVGGAVNNTVVTTGSTSYAMSVLQIVPKMDIDVRAQRKLEDDNRLYLTLTSFGASDVRVSYLIRALLKE